MKAALLIILSCILLQGFKEEKKSFSESVIASGQMPNIVRDKEGILHLVYGSGDSLMYAYSKNKGESFSHPSLITVLPKLAASHTRGPQLAITSTGLLVAVCNSPGNIFSYTKTTTGKWQSRGRVNDVDTVAKENLMALSAEGQNAFAVWLDLRDKRNKIFGARSTDGGKTWGKNTLVYASPDGTVCECCKPSVVMKGKEVYVMFRNWLSGNRDLYLIHSSNGGISFNKAEKLGTGFWALKGCPMDGGALALNKNGNPQTVWNRKGKIYACEPGKEEKELGEGRSCTIASASTNNLYAWVEKGEVVILQPNGTKLNLGKGQLPVLNVIDEQHFLCVWENDKQIHKQVITL